MAEDAPGAAAIVAAARGAVGARFRLHGRDPASGLDCVGLVAHACAGGAARAVASGYPLRGGTPAAIGDQLRAHGLAPVADAAPGDVLLFAAGPAQLHLAIATDIGCVHADAALRRVVERPGPAPWPLLGVWRLTDGKE